VGESQKGEVPMRTRIIQDDPEPPGAQAEKAAPPVAEERHNLAARMGRWSAKHRKKAILGWIAFVLLAYMVGGKVGTDTLSDVESGVGDSGEAAKLVDERYPQQNGEMVIVQSETLKTNAPEVRAAVDDVIASLDGTGASRTSRARTRTRPESRTTVTPPW
jgi:uncharacterized membrane protein YdfJ with MMPL/SSD domain